MDFEWDATKDAENQEKHGISFTAATSVFDDPHHLEEDSTKPEYGEERKRAIGMVQGRLVTVIDTDRPTGRRSISARRARDNERACSGQRTTTE